MYAIPFRRTVARQPKKDASRGAVATPTIMRVETNTAIWATPAPCSIRTLAMGKATKAGIRVADPTREARNCPKKPLSSP